MRELIDAASGFLGLLRKNPGTLNVGDELRRYGN